MDCWPFPLYRTYSSDSYQPAYADRYLQAGYASGDPEKRVSLDNSDDIDISDRLICAFSIDQHHLQDLLPRAFQ